MVASLQFYHIFLSTTSLFSCLLLVVVAGWMASLIMMNGITSKKVKVDMGVSRVVDFSASETFQ
jgi:hypothetical protein